MNEKFPAKIEPSGIIPSLLISILFLALGIYFTTREDISLIITVSFIGFGGLALFGGITSLKTSYHVTGKGLLIKKGLSKKLFPLNEMKSVRLLRKEEVEEMLVSLQEREEELKGRTAPGGPIRIGRLVSGNGIQEPLKELKNIILERANLLAYSTAKTSWSTHGASKTSSTILRIPVYSKYKKPKSIKAHVKGNFVLLETTEGRNYLLTPKNPERLVMYINTGISNQANAT